MYRTWRMELFLYLAVRIPRASNNGRAQRRVYTGGLKLKQIYNGVFCNSWLGLTGHVLDTKDRIHKRSEGRKKEWPDVDPPVE